MKIHLGWGGNLGDRAACWAAAREALTCRGVRLLRESSIYETEPVGRKDQPRFLNGAVEAESDLTPWQLLILAKSIEAALGRRSTGKDRPRPIDIDILLMGETVLRTAGLTIPHIRLAERRFVLVPLAEIAPGLRHPVLKAAIQTLLRRCPDPSWVELWPG
ncbi:MAG: 2-amino-4-hydroxy-6-hydroxymethyldihydropteridine diphosphokinase [Candidatus Aminicenantes bacterium]|nr:2-amino-4-hydroxy-6-hydroxymethyldihydropteridine diphosphokinase [Candidatus Aminicenantes bacterium]